MEHLWKVDPEKGVLYMSSQDWPSLNKFNWVKVSEVAQSCPTFWDPMDCSLSESSVHGIFQARIQEWVAISFSRGSFWPRDWTQVSFIIGRCFTVWATRDLSKWIFKLVQTLNLTYIRKDKFSEDVKL